MDIKRLPIEETMEDMKSKGKNIPFLVLVLLIVLSFLAGCGAKTGETVPSATAKESQKKSLVVYFSRTGEQYAVGNIDKGNTAIVAEMIAQETGADLFELVPEEDHYPTDSYSELTEICQKERSSGARPAYKGTVPDLKQYDTIYIGSPVWWGDFPMIVYTFLENNDLSGKKLVPFNTNEGSGLSGFDTDLRDTCPNSTVLKGLAITGSDAQNTPDQVQQSVRDWLADLPL